MTTIQTRAGRVAYRESGSGPTVLLLHATLHDRHDYDPIVDALARRYRTIAVDWPGHGDSDPVDACHGAQCAASSPTCSKTSSTAWVCRERY